MTSSDSPLTPQPSRPQRKRPPTTRTITSEAAAAIRRSAEEQLPAESPTDALLKRQPDALAGNVYDRDDGRVLALRVAAFAAKRWPRLREDIEQAALLGLCEATAAGPADAEVIARAAKRQIRVCLIECEQLKDFERDLTSDANPAASSEAWTVRQRRAIEDFDKLPPPHREALRLHYAEGWTAAAVAAKVQMTTLTTRQLLRRYAFLLGR